LPPEFAHTYVREIKHIMPYEVLTVEGRVLVPVFQDADSVVLNAGSKFEYELSVEDVALVRELWAAPLPEQAAS
jgi:hypothetical protein